MKYLLPILGSAMVAFIMSDAAMALPRFASRTAWKCQACHVNPSGGGMRQVGGVRYGREDLPVPTWSEELGLEDFSTQLSDFVSVGADVRTLFFYMEDPTLAQNAFFQMQGDVYMNFKLAKKVNIYLDKGLYTGFEIFGLVTVLPGNGFVKVGKFTPNFGTKVDDHRTYIREFTGLSPETGNPYLTGAEVGFSPGLVTFTGGIFNTSDARGAATGNDKSFLGRAEGIFGLTEEVSVGIGGNILYKNQQGGKANFMGGFGSFSYQDFTLMGEVDLLKTDLSGVKTDAVIIYAEADYMLTSGVDLKVIYDFYDQDLDLKTGSFSRYSFGLELFPVTGVEVRPLYRILKEEPTETSNNELHVLVHFYL